MLRDDEIKNLIINVNPGVEYEYALYYTLGTVTEKQEFTEKVLQFHSKREKILEIINSTDVSEIQCSLKSRGLSLEYCTLETQNDDIGPADVVMHVCDLSGQRSQIGISVKYANSCTLNVTGRKFISPSDISYLKEIQKEYSEKFIKEQTDLYGKAQNWFRQRKQSHVTDEFIDKIRDCVISHWDNLDGKNFLIKEMFQMTSPIEYWVFEYLANGRFFLCTKPPHIKEEDFSRIIARKYQSSYVAFYLDDCMIGKMQVKFNNGFLEKPNLKLKTLKYDFVVDGEYMRMGMPVSSWNFSVIYY